MFLDVRQVLPSTVSFRWITNVLSALNTGFKNSVKVHQFYISEVLVHRQKSNELQKVLRECHLIVLGGSGQEN